MRMRPIRSVLALALVAAFASPLVSADAVPARDEVRACAENVEVPEIGVRACRTVEQLASGAAQHCRQVVGADPETCATFDGEVVSAEAVAAHERSELGRRLADLRAAEFTRPIRDARIIATHNSYNASSEFPTLSNSDPNQTFDMTDQLRLGARMLELDIKWIQSPFGQPENSFMAATLCHGAGNIGCSYDRPLADGLAEIAAFLDERPDEVVLVDLRDTSAQEAEAKAAIAADLLDAFGERIWTPGESAALTGSPAFPIGTSLASIHREGGRVLLFGTDLDAGLVHREDRRQSNTPLDYPLGDCDATVARDTATHWTRYWEDTTWLAAMAGSTGLITPEIAADQFTCGINAISLDHLVPGDDRLTAIVDAWSAEQTTG